MKVMNEGSNTKAVVQTYWRKIATDNEHGHVVSFEGATPFTSVNVPEGQFIPYEELTEEIVLSWIKVEAEVGQYRDHIDGVLAATVTGGTLSYSWNTRKAANGSHVLQAVAKDQANNVASNQVVVSK